MLRWAEFTFHYELIITLTTLPKQRPLTMIYISLWTNYNQLSCRKYSFVTKFTFHYELIITESTKAVRFIPIAFTFHYELIITDDRDNIWLKWLKFTFHYELIITFVRCWIVMCLTCIYISLWTNYNGKKILM